MPQNSNSKIVLAFDSTFVLVAIFNSQYMASKMTNTEIQQIIQVCDGKGIAAHGFYWRAADTAELLFDCDDIGKLTLFQYDRECGCDRKVYRTRKMKKSDIVLESEYMKQKQSKKKC